MAAAVSTTGEMPASVESKEPPMSVVASQGLDDARIEAVYAALQKVRNCELEKPTRQRRSPALHRR